MPNPVTKATRRSLAGLIEQTLRLVSATLEAQQKNPGASLADHRVDIELDQDVEGDRTTGTDLGAEVEGQINPSLPANAKLTVGLERDNQRKVDGGVAGRFGYTLNIPPLSKGAP